MNRTKKAAGNQVGASRARLENPYAHLNGEGDFDGLIFSSDRREHLEISKHSQYASQKNREEQIAREARNLQRAVWDNRHVLWPDGPPDDPVDLLDPVIAARQLGYEFELADDLGDFADVSRHTRTAGMINRATKRIAVSRRPDFKTRTFTALHEIGHAVLHQGITMHRDRPIDGPSANSTSRSPIEWEADKFATYYLMPGRLVTRRFIEAFGSRIPFEITDDALFSLDTNCYRDTRTLRNSVRELSRALSKAERFGTKRFHSLASQFHVSEKAMAIRLEELGLISTA